MASEDDVNISFGGTIEGLQAAVSEAAEETESLLAPVNEVTEAIQRMGEAWVAALGVEKLLGMAEAAEEYGDKLGKANEETGISVENLSALNVAADHADVGFDTLQRGLAKFAMAVQDGAAGTGVQARAFTALGISQDELKEKGNDTAEMLELVAQKLDAFGDGANKQAIVMALFGARLRDIQPILTDLAQNGFEGLRQKAQEVGGLFSGEFAADMKKAHDATVDYQESTKNLGIELGSNLLPIITRVETRLANLFTSHGREENDLTDLKLQAADLEETIRRIQTTGNQHDILYNLFHTGETELPHLIEYLNEIKEKIETIEGLPEIVITHDKKEETFKPDAPQLGGEPEGAADQQAKAQSQMAVWQAGLDQQLMAEQNFFADSKAEELAYWQSKLALTAQGSQEQLAVERQVYTLTKELAQQARATDDAMSKEEAASEAALGKIKIQQQKDELAAEVDAKKVTAAQKIAIEKDLANQEYQLDLAALQAELATLADQPIQYQKTYDQILALKAKHNQQMAALDLQAAAAQKQQLAQMQSEWERALNPITSSFNSSIMGMIKGTTNLKTAVGNLASSMLSDLISSATKAAEKWIAKELTQTAATEAGNAERTASDAAANDAGLLGMLISGIRSIMTDAGQTAAGVTAFLAPTMGPAAVPAGVAAGQTITSIALGMTAAGGAWSLPSDMLVQAHAKESILPASIASPMRDFFSGGGQPGGGGDTYNITMAPQVSAIDGQSVVAHANQYAAIYAKAIMSYISRNPSARATF